MTSSANWWDRIAEKYARSPIADEAAYQRKLELTREHFTPESEVLEFGCGTGGTAIAHAPHVRHVLATDISEEMLKIARDKAATAGVGNVTFEQADFDTLEAGEFDAVLGLSILHLLSDPRQAIQRAYELTRPGGVFVSSTACLGDKMWFLRPIAPIMKLFGVFPPVLRFFSARELRRNIEDAGFEVEYEWRPEKAVAVFIIARRPD
ncbi:class I SAM-dependent methyltransferase [Maricaulis sp.]|uniref:class I SAM-dependent methyltransferase n=1 Tax=Maricaulis sp. TaxID=1486257 RepID=UPI00263607D1|nr:class I SAM-dependent methyltransferase [Maricaulis sp.]